MTTPPTTRPWQQANTDTPALCRKLAQLLTVWQQIESGKNPVWERLASLPGFPTPTVDIRKYLGNLQDNGTGIFAELRKYNLIVTTLGRVGSERLHERNHASWDAMHEFVATLWPASDPHDAIQTTIEKCQVIGHKSGLPFALWTTITAEPHTSGQAATAVGLLPKEAGVASKALGKLVDCGLAHAPIHKGQFRIYRGIDGLGFLQDAGKLVDAGIIKL